MKSMIAGAIAGVLAIAAPVMAQEQPAPVVVELYTAQGCSSCPPADTLLGQLADDPRIIALALHVDYWDYLGWKDKFADPKFTKRQKAYAKAVKDRMIYTPQMIIQGQDRVVGSRPEEVDAAISGQLGRESGVTLHLSRDEGGILIRAAASPPPENPLWVQLIRFRPEEQVAIKKGENAGMKMTYRNIVTSWQRLGEWKGQQPLEMRADLGGGDPAVVIIQRAGPAEILAAQLLR
ncbi:MAG: DUF1223 domain-containing protein [Pseudorhodobacter sp.]